MLLPRPRDGRPIQQAIRVFTTTRRHTNQKKQVAQTTLGSFDKLVTFADHGYTYALTAAFQQAITRAEAAAAEQNRRENSRRR